MVFMLSRYSFVRIFGEAFTLFNTEPFIPIEAFARAYSMRRFSQLYPFNLEEKNMLFPA